MNYKWSERWSALWAIAGIVVVINVFIHLGMLDSDTARIRACKAEVAKYRAIIVDSLNVEALK